MCVRYVTDSVLRLDQYATALTIHHVKSSNVVVQSHRTVHTIKTKLQEIMKGTCFCFGYGGSCVGGAGGVMGWCIDVNRFSCVG